MQGSSGKHKGPDGTAARKMRNLNELHKRCPPAPPLKGTATEAAEITSSPTQRLRGAASGAAVQTSDIGRASRELTTEAAASTDGGFAKREGRDEGIADSPMNTTDHPDKGTTEGETTSAVAVRCCWRRPEQTMLGVVRSGEPRGEEDPESSAAAAATEESRRAVVSRQAQQTQERSFPKGGADRQQESEDRQWRSN